MIVLNISNQVFDDFQSENIYNIRGLRITDTKPLKIKPTIKKNLTLLYILRTLKISLLFLLIFIYQNIYYGLVIQSQMMCFTFLFQLNNKNTPDYKLMDL